MAGPGSSTLVISGGVRENTLTSAASAANFTSITIQNTAVEPKQRTYPRAISGLPATLSVVQFTFDRFIRQLFVDDLAAISVHQFAELPRTHRGGATADAVAQNSTAELVKFTYSVRDGRDGSSNTESFWGVFQLQNVSRDGTRESGQIVAFPCDVLRFSNITTYYANPDITF